MGSIGALIPFEQKEDVNFFTLLEMYLRLEVLPLCGRDHVSFRSQTIPIKDVIDGDLCEMFSTLSYTQQKVLSEELGKKREEVNKKLEDMRLI